jgi:hypothetical protein
VTTLSTLELKAITDKLVDMKSEVDQTDREAKNGLVAEAKDGLGYCFKQEPRGKFPRDISPKKWGGLSTRPKMTDFGEYPKLDSPITD